jgi:hypothetical protein
MSFVMALGRHSDGSALSGWKYRRPWSSSEYGNLAFIGSCDASMSIKVSMRDFQRESSS